MCKTVIIESLQFFQLLIAVGKSSEFNHKISASWHKTHIYLPRRGRIGNELHHLGTPKRVLLDLGYKVNEIQKIVILFFQLFFALFDTLLALFERGFATCKLFEFLVTFRQLRTYTDLALLVVLLALKYPLLAFFRNSDLLLKHALRSLFTSANALPSSVSLSSSFANIEA